MAAETRIGTRIKRARERKRMSQADLADALGVSRSAVNAWENDRALPASSIGAINEVLGVNLDAPPSFDELMAALKALPLTERIAVLDELAAADAGHWRAERAEREQRAIEQKKAEDDGERRA